MYPTKAQGGDRPARRIGPSRIANTALVAAVGEHVWVESFLEAAFVRLVSAKPNVERIQTQPITFEWITELGAKRVYTPDVAIHYRNQSSELVEVKHTALLERDREALEVKFQYANAWAERRGWRFYVVTERDISLVVAENLKFLKRYQQGSLVTRPQDGARLLDALCRLGETTPKALLAAITSDDIEKSLLLTSLWRLVADGDVKCDLMSPLTMKTLIRLSGGAAV